MQRRHGWGSGYVAAARYDNGGGGGAREGGRRRDRRFTQSWLRRERALLLNGQLLSQGVELRHTSLSLIQRRGKITIISVNHKILLYLIF
jgi:hypothetical protein